MGSIGPGVMEIRFHEPHEHRVAYVAKFEEAVYVLHAFEKKTRKTDQRAHGDRTEGVSGGFEFEEKSE